MLKERCLSFIGTLRFYAEETRDQQLAEDLKLSERQIQEV